MSPAVKKILLAELDREAAAYVSAGEAMEEAYGACRQARLDLERLLTELREALLD